jgi:hypothetical protein
MRQFRRLISSYDPADIDRRLKADINNIKDQSFWIMTIAFAGMFHSLDFEKCDLLFHKEADLEKYETIRQSFMTMNEHVKYEGRIFREILVGHQFEEFIQLLLFQVLSNFIVHGIGSQQHQQK